MKRLSYMLLIFALIPQSTYPTKKKKVTAPTEAQQELFKDYQEKYKKIIQLLPSLLEISKKIPEKKSWFSTLTLDSDGAEKTKQAILTSINSITSLISETPQEKSYTKNLKKKIDGIYNKITQLTKYLYTQTTRSEHALPTKIIASTTSRLSGRGAIKNSINPIIQKMAKVLSIKEKELAKI